ncbi:MAG: TetR/AcrR family transcriptional regulator [Gammaproteobacteria bacterium]|nr:TetR/AcrR family transcriptional regulator [Gammaproteobacteria bacterium]MBU1623855.1 TetR/AcrR family transcriptional regulator [Gammaproteobacteria bacterium]MBU1982072.1 TetR/AcrR family transcriptional regulator [Gammaproteobacteria bacterium]
MNQQTNSAAPTRQRRKEARPAELTAAALELFVERGFAATKLDDVAARAGVSKGTLYLYFASKEELFKAVIQQGILPVLEEGEAMLAQHQGDASTLLSGLLLRWWELLGGTSLSGIPKLMIAEAGNFPEVARYYHDNVIQRAHELFGQVLRKGIARKEFRKVDVETAIDVIIAPQLMMAIWQHSMTPCSCGGMKDPAAFIRTHIDLLLNGLSTKE